MLLFSATVRAAMANEASSIAGLQNKFDPSHEYQINLREGQ